MHKTLDIFNKAFLSLYFDKLIEEPTYSITLSTPPHTWNVASMLKLEGASIEKEVKEIEKKFPMQNGEVIFWLTEEDTPRNIETILKNMGYYAKGSDLWMLRKPQERIIPSSDTLGIQEVSHDQEMEDFTRIFKEVFHDYNEGIIGIFRKKLFDQKYEGKNKIFIGYLDKTPVTICGYTIYENYAIMYAVATLPQYRNKGYAKTICQYAINNIPDKEILLLTETDNPAQYMYQKLGFKNLFTTKIYAKLTRG